MKRALTLGERLRLARKRRDLTQTEVADAIGVDRNAVGEWENDKRIPTGENLIALRDLYDVSGHWLMTDEGSPDVEDPSELNERMGVIRVLATDPRDPDALRRLLDYGEKIRREIEG